MFKERRALLTVITELRLEEGQLRKRTHGLEMFSNSSLLISNNYFHLLLLPLLQVSEGEEVASAALPEKKGEFERGKKRKRRDF